MKNKRAPLEAPTKTILVSEIFGPTIQGEGSLVGRPTVFVRTGGCDFRCSWCDTLYAVLPEFKEQWKPLSAEAIFDEVCRLTGGRPILITLSGGNPALQPLEPLLDLGRRAGYTFALETQASVSRDWFAKLDFLVLSPKGPSSGMTTDWDDVRACVTAGSGVLTVLKIVVFDETDYQFSREAAAKFPELPMVLQAGNDVNGEIGGGTARVEWLLQRISEDGWYDVQLLPQVHVLLWGNRRGV